MGLTLPDHKTKTVCTIGPASRSETVFEELMRGDDDYSPEGIMKFIGESALVREDDKIVVAEDTSPGSVDSTDSLRTTRFSPVQGGAPAE